MNRAITWCLAGVLAVVILIGAAAGSLVSAINGDGGCHAALGTPGAPPAGLSAEQADNARVIVTVGQRMTVPVHGWVIAIATALQESNLINLDHGDRDSLGLFQQRPSQGWGTPQQIMNPDYAATRFYEALLRVPGWETMPLTQAAQAVQRSAYPNAYAKHEARAEEIVAAYAGDIVCDAGSVGLPPGFTLPPGTPAPVVAAIGWALAQLGTPYSYGGDCTDPHGGNPAHQCDCSSLTQQSYRTAGISIPRVTVDQVHAGSPVGSVADLHPGDLIFIPGSYGTSASPRHVGMAIGSGLLIQAPNTGDVVKISKVSDWANQIAAIRRIVPS